MAFPDDFGRSIEAVEHVVVASQPRDTLCAVAMVVLVATLCLLGVDQPAVKVEGRSAAAVCLVAHTTWITRGASDDLFRAAAGA